MIRIIERARQSEIHVRDAAALVRVVIMPNLLSRHVGAAIAAKMNERARNDERKKEDKEERNEEEESEEGAFFKRRRRQLSMHAASSREEEED